MAKKNENKKKNKNIKSISLKRFIIFILIIFLILFSIYISNNKFREFVDINVLRKIVKEEKLKEIYDNVNSQNVFVSNKNIHILNQGEIKNYDKNGNLISSNILGIGNAISDQKNEYMVIAEKNGKKVFLFEKGKLKWERETDINIHNIFVNKNGHITLIGDSSMYTSIIIVMDSNGDQYLKKYFSSKYASKAQISQNNKYLVTTLIDYSKLQISSEIEIIEIEKAKKDTSDAIINRYTKDELIIDMEIQSNEEILIKCIDAIYLADKKEMKKVYDLKEDTIFAGINISDGFATICEKKSNLFSQTYELKLFDKLGGNIGVLILEQNMPKHLHTNDTNVAIEMPQSILIASDLGWLKKKYNSNKNFIDVKISDGLAAIIYTDKVAIMPL